MPSSIAARVAETASSMRCFFSLSSTSVAAPTLIDADAAGQLGEPLLELLAVPVGVGVLDLGLDLVDPALDLGGVAAAVDDRGVVLGDRRRGGPVPSTSRPTWSSLRPTSGATTWPPVRVAMSCIIALRRSPKAGALTATALKVPRILLTTRVDSASPSTSSARMNSGLPACDDLLQQRQQVGDRGDLALVEQDVGVVEDGLHALRVGDEVRRDVALVELHALGELELGAHGVGLLDGDHAVLADLVERLGEQLADDARRGWRWWRPAAMSSLVVDLAGGLAQRVADGLDGGVHAALEAHRVGAGGDGAQALVDHRLGEHGRGGGAVTGDVVGLGGDLLGQLGAEVLERVVELDLAGDGDAVVGDGGGAPLLVEDDVAALGAERHLDGVGELVDAALEGAAGVLVELQDLGHLSMLLLSQNGDSPDAPAGPRRRSAGARSDRTIGCRDQETTASTSRAERMRYSSPAYLTSVPPYLL